MALENTAARYEIVVAKTGDGATQTATELTAAAAAANNAAAALKTVSAAAAGAGAAAGVVSSQTVNLAKDVKSASAGFKVFNESLLAMGFQSFPQLTTGIVIAKNAMKAAQLGTIEATASLTIMSAGIAGLAAALISAGFAWDAYKAKQFEATTAKSLSTQTAEFNKDLKAAAKEALETGKITEHEFDEMIKKLSSLSGAGNEAVRDSLKNLKSDSAANQLGDLAAKFENKNAYATNKAGRQTTYDRVDKEKDYQRALEQSLAIEEKINQLEKDREITAADAKRLRLQADTKMIQSLTQVNAHLTEIQKTEQHAAQSFASGLSQAIVDFANGSKTAKEAFKEFAVSFLSEIAKMIIEQTILNAISSYFKSSGSSSASGTSMQALGGVTYAANGIASVNSATYFPRFNVVAGEAGREMLTVLARPRFMEIGGMEAVVGNAGRNRLAITNADELQKSGGKSGVGGNAHIHVTMDQGLRAEIVEQSVRGAVVQVTHQAGQNTNLRKAIKGANR